MSDEPNPYAALARLLTLPPRVQRRMLRLEVWCERNACTPVRVFGMREGMLVQCRSDADVRGLQETYPNLEDWSKRRAFFLESWLSSEADHSSRLQVVCDCLQTKSRLVSVAALVALLETDTRSVSLTRVTAPDLEWPL